MESPPFLFEKVMSVWQFFARPAIEGYPSPCACILVDLPLLERRQLLACRAHDGVGRADVESVVAVLVRAGFLLFLLLLCFLWLVLLAGRGRVRRLERVLVRHCVGIGEVDGPVAMRFVGCGNGSCL